MSDTITMTINGITYNDIVSRKYRMNPNTENLVFGDELKNGMVVLIVGELTHEGLAEHYATSIIDNNRWCVVSKLRIEEENGVFFVGQYADGYRAVRKSIPTSGWLVKKIDPMWVCNPPTCPGDSCELRHH